MIVDTQLEDGQSHFCHLQPPLALQPKLGSCQLYVQGEGKPGAKPSTAARRNGA